MVNPKKRNIFLIALIAYMLLFNILILSKISFGFTGAAVGYKTGSLSTDMLVLAIFNIAIVLLFVLSYSAHNFFYDKETRIASLKKIDEKHPKKKKR